MRDTADPVAGGAARVQATLQPWAGEPWRYDYFAVMRRLESSARPQPRWGKALLPGFFDLHTHWATSRGFPTTTPQIATAYVQSGVTTVNDYNHQPESFAPRREWLSHLVAPHVNFAARLSTPGGHGADWADEATTITVNTPRAARYFRRRLIRAGRERGGRRHELDSRRRGAAEYCSLG